MAELYHLGIDDDAVPATVVIAEPEFATVSWPPQWGCRPLARRREFSSNGLTVDGTDVLVCCGAFGAPAAVIALEELVRAGARRVLGLALCRCTPCRTVESEHAVVLASGAERSEGTSADYAPPAYPAVPDAGLLTALRQGFPGAMTTVVRTVDVLPEWLEPGRVSEGDEPVDLMTSALLVAAAATGVTAASVLVGDEQKRDLAAVCAIRAVAGVPMVVRV